MAAAAPNSVGALTANPFGGDLANPGSCLDDPNFATICSFIQNFGDIIRIGRIPFDDLQQMLENSADAPPPLVQLHITLLRRVFKTVTPDKWERSLAKFGHTYCSQDAWEIERFGYKKAKISTKLRLLKNLLEAQFDYNVKFKAEVNKLQAADLRLNPLGRDTEGQLYWYQVDEDANLRVYREDIDDETWEIVASNRDELEDLISQLQRGEVKKPEPEEAIVVPEEDSNSKDDIEPKEIILDTGKVDDEGSNENSDESEDGVDGKEETRTVEPLIIKHSFNLNRIQTSEVDTVKSDVDNVKYEISNSESEPKVPGIKLVFGVKSKPKGTAEPNSDVAPADSKEQAETETTNAGSASAVEDASTSSSKWSICTTSTPALPQPTNIVPKSEQSKESPLINVEERIGSNKPVDPPVKIPTQTEKAVPPVKTPTQTEKVLPPVKIPTQTEKAVPPVKTPTPTEKVLPPVKIPTQTEKAVPPVKIPTPTEKVLPPVKIPTPTEKVSPPIKIPTQTEKVLPPVKIPTPTEKVSPPIKIPTQTDKVSPPIKIPTQTDKVSPPVKIPTQPEKVSPPAKIPTQTEKALPTSVDAKISSTLSNELTTKSVKRELQTKASKNLQKSAKVNSIVERLNKNLPENSAKTVADLLPPPEITKSHTVTPQQREDKRISAVGKSETGINLSKDNTLSVTKVDVPANLAVSQNDTVDLSAKSQRSKPVDLTKTISEAPHESQLKSTLDSHRKSKIPRVEKESQPQPTQETGSVVKDVEIKATRKSLTSITSELHSLSRNVTIQEAKNEPSFLSMLGATAGASDIAKITEPKRKSIPKDNEAGMPVRTPTVVPMKDINLQPSGSTMTVVEEIIEKKKAWICGKDAPVEEKLVVKESTWLCGKTEIPVEETLAVKEKELLRGTEKGVIVEEKPTVKESTGLCDKKEIPVEEKLAVKEKAWLCGKEERAPVDEKPAVKESAWVCGVPDQTPADSGRSKSDSEVKEESVQVFPSSTESKMEKESIVSKPPIKTTSVLTSPVASEPLQNLSQKNLPIASSLVKESIIDPPSLDNTKSNQTNQAIVVTPPSVDVASNDVKIIATENSPLPVPGMDNSKDAITSKTKTDTLQHTSKELATEVAEVTLPPPQIPAKINAIERVNAESASVTPPAPVCIEEGVTATGSSECPVVKDMREESLVETKPFVPENLLPVPPVEERAMDTQRSVSPVQPKAASAEENIVEMKAEVTHLPPAISTEDVIQEPNPIVPQSLPSVPKVESNITEIVPVKSLPSPRVEEKESHQQCLADQDNKSKIDDSVSEKEVISDTGNFERQADKNNENQKVSPESTPVSAKANSSLVLYSESSDSSNDAFVIDTSRDNPIISTNTVSEEIKETTIEAVNSGSDTSGAQNAGALRHEKDLSATDLNKPDPTKTEGNISAQPSTLESTNENGKAEALKTSEVERDDVNNKTPEVTPDKTKQSVDTAGTDIKHSDSKPLDSSLEGVDSTSSAGTKRKAEDEVESLQKIRKLENVSAQPQETNTSTTEVPFNPIVGDTVEEEVLTITGEGSGAMNEGRNSPPPFNPICGETIEEDVMTITGTGFGVMNEGSNENSPVSLAVADVSGSQNESIEESDESRDAFAAFRGRGGRRGRGRRGRPPAGAAGARSSQPSTTPRNSTRGSRGSREVARLGVSLDSVEVNGENERPVRASRRIAQIRLKEEEERRQLEEERLAQLKAAQMQKKAKQEKEKDTDHQSPGLKVKKAPGRKSQKNELQFARDYVPSGSESEDNSEEEEGSDEFSGKLGKGGKRRKRRKNGKAKKGGNPWATSDEDEEEEQVEEEEEYHEEEEEEDLVFKSDHEFSPESDLGEDDDIGPSRHARTAKQDKGDLFEEGNCCKCGKGDHPEWILLCDKCDKGWHASCLRPQLWVVPEGEWFCPPCQHNMLIENLSKNLVEYESLLKKRENEILRKQRLAYVGISLDNVLPDKEPEAPEPDHEQEEKVDREKRRQRRRILSDEELSDFINDNDSNDDLSNSRSGSGSDEDSDEPVYRLRARRTKKAFDFKEYDDMINSALRVDDDEEVEMEKVEEEDDEDEEEGSGKGKGGGKKINGKEDEEDPDDGVGGGKNDAYLKHLERQAQEEDETDEELLDEKERLRRKEMKKQGHKKTRRRINDLDAYSEEEDSDDDFKASEAEDEDEEAAEEGESEWSGDKMEDDSDDSIAKRARRKDRHGSGRHRRLGRREKYSDKGLVRRSTRKRRSRISYDESDDDDEEEEDQNDKWQSGEESEEEEESESNSESDDATWGKRKKKQGFAAAKPKLSSFVLGAGAPSSSKGKGKGGVKRKKRKTDDDDVDRAWNSARGKKDKDEPIERRTRGRKINFKDILDSGESDDDGNVRPKRRPLSDSEDSRSPSSSRRLAEEIRAENARKAKEYEESQAKMGSTTNSQDGMSDDTKMDVPVATKDLEKDVIPPIALTMSDSHTIAKLAESSVNKVAFPSPPHKVPPSPIPAQLPVHHSPTHAASPSPNNIPLISSPPLNITPTPVMLASVAAALQLPPNSSPLLLSSPPPPLSLPSTVGNASNTPKRSDSPSVLSKSPPAIPFIPKTIPSNIGPLHPLMHTGPVPALSAGLVPPSISAGSLPQNLTLGHVPPIVPAGSLQKSNMSPIPPPVPVPILTEKKSSKSKGSRGSRGSKSEKQVPLPPVPVPSDLELALSKPVKNSPLGTMLSSKSSSKKKDRGDREGSRNVPSPNLLLSGSGGVLPELLGAGLPSSLRQGSGVPGITGPSSGSSSSSKKSKSSGGSSRATQQTTPPPVSQNLSPSLPIDIDRVPNPALFQGNPGMRPFHPMWAVRNPGPPPPGYSPSGSPVPASLGKPPPLNTSPFSGQQGPPPRPGFSSPPPLRIPNPNTSPLQAFQHFKRDGPLGPMYRLATGQPQAGVPLPNILPPGMMSPHAGGPERFFSGPPGYPHPYGLLPPHSQGPPQALFPYDYRVPEPPFKEEPQPAPPRTTASSLPTPVSSASSSPPPTTSAPVPLPTKDEGSAARDSEFGGLVSYFSSQRSEEDMDT